MAAASQAESMWEDATGRNLFTYDETSNFPINLVYDSRQAYTDAEKNLQTQLQERGDENASIKSKYQSLLDNYNAVKAVYEQKSADFEKNLQDYNAEVDKWNKTGGAPPDVYAQLSDQQKTLADEQKKLNDTAYELNQLVTQINSFASEGNNVLSDYNKIVDEYNKKFSEDREFTQGDYEGNLINIYQYDSRDELVIVIAHEMGHALGLDHVEGSSSVMFHLLADQTLQSGLSTNDIVEFQNVCGTGGLTLGSVFQIPRLP
jgi:hypothetical protein